MRSTDEPERSVDQQKTMLRWHYTPQQVVWGVGAFMWDVLLPTTEEAMKMVNSDLLTKDLILRTEYRGMRKTSVAVLEVPPCVRGKALAAYFLQFGQILGVS